MTVSVQIDTIRNRSQLPTDASFFDLYDGETLVAHIQRPRVYNRDARWRVTLYRADRTALRVTESSFPIAIAKGHARTLRRAR